MYLKIVPAAPVFLIVLSYQSSSWVRHQTQKNYNRKAIKTQNLIIIKAKQEFTYCSDLSSSQSKTSSSSFVLLTGAPQSKSELSVFCAGGPQRSSDVSVFVISKYKNINNKYDYLSDFTGYQI